MSNNKRGIEIFKYFLMITALVLLVKYSEGFVSLCKNLKNAAMPLIYGLALAYVLNILMKEIEKVYFPNSNNKYINGSRRVVSILLSLLLVLGIVVIVSLIVIPEFIRALSSIIKAAPGVFDDIKNFIDSSSKKYDVIGKSLETSKINTDKIFQGIMATSSNILKSVLNSTISLAGSLTNGLMNFIIALTFAIYSLANKESIGMQIRKVMKAFLKESTISKIDYLIDVTHASFSNFIVGKFVDAIILGAMCAFGMFIFKFPYVATVSALICVTALLPIVGGYIGGALGAFMILSVSPMQALFFLIFLCVLQEFEGKVIYPRVVGSSMGLPGIWVFAAITIGGGLGGIIGMLISVPIAATLYRIFSDRVNFNLGKKEKVNEL